MNLKDIFSVFSHRNPTEELDKLPTLPESFRNRVLLLIRKRWGNAQSGNYLSSFWEDMHEKLTMSVGRGHLKGRIKSLQSFRRCDKFFG